MNRMLIRKYLGVFIFSFTCCITASAQKTLPDVSVQTARGGSVLITEYLKEVGPVILSFWATSCKPCIMELNALNDCYDEWQAELDFEVVAVSVDDARSCSKVIPMVKGKGWVFEILFDTNEDLKRAMNVTSIPATFIIDKKGNIKYVHKGYTPGCEKYYYDILKNL